MLLLAAAGRTCVSIPALQRPTPGSVPHHRVRLPPIVSHYRRRHTGPQQRLVWRRVRTPPQRPEPLSRPVRARDRVIRFGKYNGKMMGTIPPWYLRWIVAELEFGQDAAPWAQLAREVLDDPVYVDRDEWDRYRNVVDNYDGDGPLPDMFELFGWDRSGWSRVDIDLIGTSYSGRIPRKGVGKQSSSSSSDPAGSARKKGSQFDDGSDPDGPSGKRGHRRERMRLRRDDQVRAAKLEMLGVNAAVADDGVPGAPRKARVTTAKEEILGLGRGNLAGKMLQEKRKAGKGGQGSNPFPGRQAFLDKVRKLKDGHS